MTYIIIKKAGYAGTETSFWTGSKWSIEYPDAKLYTTMGYALADFHKSKAHAIIQDYGLTTERVVIA